MKKHDKYKPAKPSLFAEKLAKAREQKISIEKPPPAPAKKNLPFTSSPSIIETSKPIETIADIAPDEPKIELKTSKIETTVDESNSAVTQGSEPINKFQQIMESRFAENAKATIPLVRLGIDLGTSFSKVVWRLGGENVFPVCFGKDNLDLNDYLMPSTISFDGEGVAFGFDSVSFTQSSISNFKMCLACESKNNGECGIERCSLTDWKPEFFVPRLKNEETKFVNALFLAKLLARTKEEYSLNSRQVTVFLQQ